MDELHDSFSPDYNPTPGPDGFVSLLPPDPPPGPVRDAEAEGRPATAGYAYLLARENRHGKVEVIGINDDDGEEARGTVLYSEVHPDDVGTGWSNRKANIAARWGREYDATRTTVAEAVRLARGGDAPRPTRGYA